MPGNDAKRGDVYHVHKTATLDEDDTRDAHPMVCVAEQPADPNAWKAMPRVSTGAEQQDLPSPQQPDLPFTRDGYWTYRFLRSVKKPITGDRHMCPFMVTLAEPIRTEVLDYYKNRPRQVEDTAPRRGAH